MWCVHVFLTWMLILNGRFPKGYRCKNKKARHVTTIIYHYFFVAERMILVVSLNYQTFLVVMMIKLPFKIMYCLKKKKSKNLSLSTIVQTPLQSAGWQMVRLSTCNWNTVCRFALFVCWTQWNRPHLLAIRHQPSGSFFLSFMAGVDLVEEVYLCAGLVLRRHVVCAVWGEAFTLHPSAACSREKWFQGVIELGNWCRIMLCCLDT